ncbi:MAG: oligosaccharide flippase family protein [Saprospiraceae bacterium]|nr:oligosaccharide flippase family protein [Saprospiraceae bacterium]
MNKEFFKNALFLVAINLLIKPLYIFGIDRTVQNRVGEELYGNYAALFSFAFLLQIINDFGIQNFNSREIAQNRQLLTRYLSGILSLKLFLALVYILLLLVVAWAVGYGRHDYFLIFSLGFYNILLSLSAYLRSNVASLGLYRMNSFLSVFDRLLILFICPILLFAEPFKSSFNIEWFVHVQNLTLIISILASFVVSYRHVQWFRIQFNRPFWVYILRGAMPYALAIFLMTIYTRTDMVMLERMLPDGDKQAGIYASAYRLLDAVNVLGLLFAGLLLPMFSRQLKENQSVTPLLRFSFQLIMVAAIICAGTVWFFRTDIMQLLYHEATPYSGDVLGILMFSFVAVSGTFIYSTLIGAAGSVERMNRTFIVAFLLNIVFNVFLIPHFKALGAAFSTFCTQFFVLFSLVYLSKKVVPSTKEADGLRWGLTIVAFAAAVLIMSFVIKKLSFTPYWLVNMCVAIFMSLVLAGLMDFLNPKKIADLGVVEKI